MFYVYVIKSKQLGKIYIGHTNSLEGRLLQHKSRYSSATRLAEDWKLIHSEEYPSRSLAMKRESFLKTGDGRKVLALKGIIF